MTTTAVETLQTTLDNANPNDLADALRLIKLGTMLAPAKYDTGIINAAATVELPTPALKIISAYVKSATTAASVGSYLVTDNLSQAVVSPAASTAVGIAQIAADGQTLTFASGDITQAQITYLPAPATALSTEFSNQ